VVLAFLLLVLEQALVLEVEVWQLFSLVFSKWEQLLPIPLHLNYLLMANYRTQSFLHLLFH
jgi:hypothetical protein